MGLAFLSDKCQVRNSPKTVTWSSDLIFSINDIVDKLKHLDISV